jgi:hypothetical protein
LDAEKKNLSADLQQMKNKTDKSKSLEFTHILAQKFKVDNLNEKLAAEEKHLLGYQSQVQYSYKELEGRLNSVEMERLEMGHEMTEILIENRGLKEEIGSLRDIEKLNFELNAELTALRKNFDVKPALTPREMKTVLMENRDLQCELDGLRKNFENKPLWTPRGAESKVIAQETPGATQRNVCDAKDREIEKLRTTINNLKKYSECDDVSKQRIITINADLKSKIKILEATTHQLSETIERLTGELERLHSSTLPTAMDSLGSPDRSQMSPTKMKYLEWRKNNILDPNLNNIANSGVSKGDIPYKFLGKVLLGLPVGSKTALRPVFLRWWVRANKKPVRDVMLKF